MVNTTHRWRIWIDTGGTFTDCLAVDPEGEWHRCKVLSHGALRGRIEEQMAPRIFKIKHPWHVPDQFVCGFTFQLLSYPSTNAKIERYQSDTSILKLSQPINLNDYQEATFEIQTTLEAPILAAHVVTKTPTTQYLPPMQLRLATTKGTNTLLEHKGAQTALFLTEGFRDLLRIGNQQRPDLFSLDIQKSELLYQDVVEVPERLNADGKVLKSPDFNSIESKIEDLLSKGTDTAAIALMHSYQNAEHEKKLAHWLREKGFKKVSVSSSVSPFIKILPRTETTLVDAYLNPVINTYLDHVKDHIKEGSLHVMTSAGGLEKAEKYNPKDSLLSGPAGGVVGASAVGQECGFDQIISFDMGGTSTDVSRFDKDFDYVFEHQVGETKLVAPALSIETVAAGGGSICSFDGHALTVGPQSAGADPGPACYGAGGPLTLTDVNLLLGRLDPENFGIPVDQQAAEKRFNAVLEKVSKVSEDEVDRVSVLQSFLDIANERMANTIQKISVRKGYDVRNYGLVAFGGAGGQHACSIAQELGIQNVIIPPDAGLLSAYGLGNAVIEKFAEKQILRPLAEVSDKLDTLFDQLVDQAKERLSGENIARNQMRVRRRLLFMRLEGQESTLEIEYSNVAPERAFKKKYKMRFGHWLENRSVEVESIRVVVGTLDQNTVNETEHNVISSFAPPVIKTKSVYFEGKPYDAKIYQRDDLNPGAVFEGPALVLDPYSTLVIPPDWTAETLPAGHLQLNMKKTGNLRSVNKSPQPEAGKVELFTNRMTTIAEEMGEMLRRTALSVNVKERLDFSCGLLDKKGRMIVNAPHIPVHLGALGLCVRQVSETVTWRPGDVVVTNDPAYGGSHLPDITLITPIFAEQAELAGFAVSRAHHADIGGTRPGSMPPSATSLAEEGVVIPPTHLLKEGKEHWQQIRSTLQNAEYPSRNIEENITDLRAALAANQRGAEMLSQLLKEEDIETVQYYMKAIHRRAEGQIRKSLHSMKDGRYQATEYLDDGTPISVAMTIEEDEISFDFQGTGKQHQGNLNATPAIVNSVITYFLRLLVDEPIPLNEGLLAPASIDLPPGLLNPEFSDDPKQSPAIVGGNTETSQRLIDTLLRPFNLMACSQGTMNNLLFGNEEFGYYETLGGGTGGGPEFDGTDAVHHHMTNTRSTDPEILEYRYPVRLKTHTIRSDSGGQGKHPGGHGIERHYLFLDSVDLSVLTQHRIYAPYGLKGGEKGAKGSQFIVRSNGTREKLSSIEKASLKEGDQLIIKTPGGGGYGRS